MADGRKYYVTCKNNCKYESMTKEQILTAIANATSGGTFGDIDTGFVTTIKTITGQPLRFFVGTQAMYDGLADEQKNDLFAIITNDTEKEAMQTALADVLAEQTAQLSKITELNDRTATNESDISDLETKYTSLNSTVTSIKNGYSKPISSSYPVGTVVVAALGYHQYPLENSFSLYYNKQYDTYHDCSGWSGSTKINGIWKVCAMLPNVSAKYYDTLEEEFSDRNVFLVQRTS